MIVMIIFLIFNDLYATLLTFISLICFVIVDKRIEDKELVMDKQSKLSVKIANLIFMANQKDLHLDKIKKIVTLQEQASEVERKLKEGIYPNLKKAESEMISIENKLTSIEIEDFAIIKRQINRVV